MPSYCRTIYLCYGVLCSVYFLTSGIFNSVLRQYHRIWILVVIILSLVIMIALFWTIYKGKKQYAVVNDLVNLTVLAYIVCLLFNYIFHYAALLGLDTPFYLNIRLVTPEVWIGANNQFFIYYLYFPILFMFHRLFLGDCDLETIIKIAAAIMAISMMVLYYQVLFSPRFIAKWSLEASYIKPDGLATDPNAYVLCSVLLIAVFSIGTFMSQSLYGRSVFGALSILYVLSGILTASRTGIIAVFLCVLAVPLIVATSETQLSKNVRITLSVIPFCIVIGGYFLLPVTIEIFQAISLGEGFHRLVVTLSNLRSNSFIAGVTQGNFRILQYIVAWLLFMKAPLGGWGAGGFYREFPNEFYLHTGQFTVRNDSALNHYLMIATDLGLPVLILNLVILLLPLIGLLKALKQTDDKNTRYVLSALFSVQIIFLLIINTLPPSYFPDVLWVWTAILAISVIISQRLGVQFLIPVKRRWRLYLIIFSIVIIPNLFGIYNTSFGSNGYLARRNSPWNPLKFEKNCYEPENWKEGIIRWCRGNAVLKIPVTDKKGWPGKIALSYIALHPDTKKRPVRVRFGGRNRVTQEVVVLENTWQTVDITITADNRLILPVFSEQQESGLTKYFKLYASDYEGPTADEKTRHFYFHGYKFSRDWTLPGSGCYRYILVSIDVSRSWIPKEWGINNDTRELGVAVLVPKL